MCRTMSDILMVQLLLVALLCAVVTPRSVFDYDDDERKCNKQP